MYWFRVSKLADDFRDGRVDEKERFKYYLAALIAWTVVVYALIFSGTAFDFENLVFAGVNLVVIVVGTVLCYRVNKRGDDKDFIPRMICLGWPAGIWTGLVASILFFMYSFKALPSLASSRTEFLSSLLIYLKEMWNVLPGAMLLWVYFWFIHVGFTRIAQPKDPVEQVASGGPVLSECRSQDKEDPKARLKHASWGWEVARLPLGCLGGIAFLFLAVWVPPLLYDLGIPTRFRLLLVAPWTMTLVWLVKRLGKWEQARSQRKAG